MGDTGIPPSWVMGHTGRLPHCMRAAFSIWPSGPCCLLSLLSTPALSLWFKQPGLTPAGGTGNPCSRLGCTFAPSVQPWDASTPPHSTRLGALLVAFLSRLLRLLP